MTLISGDLRGLVTADRPLATRRCGRSAEPVLGLCYNIVLIPVAAGVLYPFTGILLDPMLAAAAMALCSVTVVSNALRLRRFSAPQVQPEAAPAQTVSQPAT